MSSSSHRPRKSLITSRASCTTPSPGLWSLGGTPRPRTPASDSTASDKIRIPPTLLTVPPHDAAARTERTGRGASGTTRENLRRRHFSPVTSPRSTPRFQRSRNRLPLPRAGVPEGLGHGRLDRRERQRPTPSDRNPLRTSGTSTQVDEDRARFETGPRRDAAGRVDGCPTRRRLSRCRA